MIPQLALDFPIASPDLQVASQLGIGITDAQFTATLWLFGVNELLGHLPIYGAMLVIMVYGSHPQPRRAVYSFRPAAQTLT